MGRGSGSTNIFTAQRAVVETSIKIMGLGSAFDFSPLNISSHFVAKKSLTLIVHSSDLNDQNFTEVCVQ